MSTRTASDGSVGRARHVGTTIPSVHRAAGRLIRSGRPQYLPLLLSDQARMIVSRRYDAFTTDRAYENAPHGALGLLGKAADALVLRFPVHAALRGRLALVVDELAAEVRRAGVRGVQHVRVLSAPCGLARDVLLAAKHLSDGPGVSLTGVDLDEVGDVLPEVERRATEAGVEILLLRGDLFGPLPDVERAVATDGRFHVVSCIGITSWIDLDELSLLMGRLHALAAPGGVLLIDLWRPDRHARLARTLGLPAHYHAPADFARELRCAGFAVIRTRPTDGAVNTLWIARST